MELLKHGSNQHFKEQGEVQEEDHEIHKQHNYKEVEENGNKYLVTPNKDE